MSPRLQAVAHHHAMQRNASYIAIVNPLRPFSTTTQRRQTTQRKKLFHFLNSHGVNFIEPLPGSTNYLSAYDNSTFKLTAKASTETSGGDKSRDHRSLSPFPNNPGFRSQSITSERLREAVWSSVMEDGRSVQEASAKFGVEMNRVGAIVRLKEIEKLWSRTGKPLAKPYAKAVMAMLPQTEYSPGKYSGHESINDLPVHGATVNQIFHPTSESRHFTRVDAAKVFDESLLPADRRVPHPELADLHRDVNSGMPYEERVSRAKQRKTEMDEKTSSANRRLRERERNAVTVASGKRWEFNFRDINVDAAGPDGKGPRGTGWRYGVPLMDRRRGEIKIPTKVW